jgi:iron(II)-dependent oxidoreductase
MKFLRMNTLYLLGGIGFFLGSVLSPLETKGEVSKAPETEKEQAMVLIPDGTFTMGSTAKDIDWVVAEFHSESREWYQDETPAQKVYLKSYFIDKREVSLSEYLYFVKSSGTSLPRYIENERFNGKNKPVMGIGWQEAVNYCKWAGKRLPTEEEWEKAARGKDARTYPWGNEANNTLANVRGMQDNYRYTAPVGDFPEGSSSYGALDMAGNVWEWTSDWYKPYKGNKHDNDLYGEKFKVIRGGSWSSNMDLSRAAVRGKAAPDQRQNFIGFRCAKNL